MGELHHELLRIIVSEEAIQKRVSELAEQIAQDYAGKGRLYIVSILKGAFIFTADLTRQLKIPHLVDFLALSSYGKSTSSGAVRILMDLREPIEDRHILIVEDIVDTGSTLAYLLKNLSGRNPASLKTCALVRKRRENQGVKVDYLGFDIPDVWVVGYGLDYADQHRTWPFIAELRPEVYAKK